MHLSYDCNFRTCPLMHLHQDSRRCWSLKALQCLVFPYFSNPGSSTLEILPCPHYSATCKDFLWSQFVSKCLYLFCSFEIKPFMIITEQQSVDKSNFERTILVAACCYQSPGPILFCKNKNKGFVSDFFPFITKNCVFLVPVFR